MGILNPTNQQDKLHRHDDHKESFWANHSVYRIILLILFFLGLMFLFSMVEVR